MSSHPAPLALGLLALLTAAPARAKTEDAMHAGQLKVALERLGTTARVLYVAAHPDDENTRLLAYLANQRHLDVAYLSLTRGGGGQNLVGTEQGELLAALRTQELLAARRIDGARQLFTRARDFGYSKSPEEALAKWGEQKILGDVVWAIRSFRPDVIITRFTEAGPSHGHHTASARLAHAAFDAARDASRFPEQLSRGVSPWPARRLVLNVPHWRNRGEDMSSHLQLDVGGYDPRLGESYPEIAARSRTMHKSQGFGAAGARGPVLEYFAPLAGPAPQADLLEGVELGWGRFEGGAAVEAALAKAQANLRAEAPERIVPALFEARAAMQQIASRRPVPRVLERIADVEALVVAALGLHVDARADRPRTSPGHPVRLTARAILRRPAEVELVSVRWPDATEEAGAALPEHHGLERSHDLSIPAGAPATSPPWLLGPHDANVFAVPDPARVHAPEGPPALTVEVELLVNGQPLRLTRAVRYVWTDRVLGERSRAVTVTPALTVTPARRTTLAPKGAPAVVELVVRAGHDGAAGQVRLPLPKGWASSPKVADARPGLAGQTQTVRFEVRPPRPDAPPIEVRPEVLGAGPALREDQIVHPHVPAQDILQAATVRIAPLDFEPPAGLVGHIPGPGDTVAEHLAAAGVKIETIDPSALRAGRLDRYASILVGVRAYNTREAELTAAHPALMRWVKAGGRLVVQYNTSNRWRRLTAPIGPFPFEIDRGRVTDETAKVTPLAPKHPLLQSPHQIRPADFEGWVQERGLYFAKAWAAEYTPIFSAHDPGEAPEQGSLLFAPYGKGAFVYTGLSFFRQLPAGVPGAYRLLANLLSPGASK